MLDDKKICRIHRTLFATDPTNLQSSLYENYPAFRGYLSAEKDSERFQAVFTLAMTQTMAFDDLDMVRTAVLIAAPTEVWAIDQLRALAQGIFDRCKETENPPKVAKYLGKVIEKLVMGNKAFRFEQAPPCWVAFGFGPDVPIPDWMDGALLPNRSNGV
jgi:hypothetical protein